MCQRALFINSHPVPIRFHLESLDKWPPIRQLGLLMRQSHTWGFHNKQFRDIIHIVSILHPHSLELLYCTRMISVCNIYSLYRYFHIWNMQLK